MAEVFNTFTTTEPTRSGEWDHIEWVTTQAPRVLTNQMHVTSRNHHVVVGMAFGDWYAHCVDCGAKSLPYAARIDVVRWVCPRADSEAEIARNQQLWDQRSTDAMQGVA